MLSEDNEDYSVDVQQHNDLSDKNSHSDWRHPLNIDHEDILKPDLKIRRRVRKSYRVCCPVHAKYNAMERRIPLYKAPRVPCSPYWDKSAKSAHAYTNTVFNKREITTIPEEVFHYKRQSKVFSSFKKKKAYREKVASLKVVVGRLNEMCLEKPEVLQNKLPEEIMRLFSGIKI